jgi:hypothetical protein
MLLMASPIYSICQPPSSLYTLALMIHISSSQHQTYIGDNKLYFFCDVLLFSERTMSARKCA